MDRNIIGMTFDADAKFQLPAPCSMALPLWLPEGLPCWKRGTRQFLESNLNGQRQMVDFFLVDL